MILVVDPLPDLAARLRDARPDLEFAEVDVPAAERVLDQGGIAAAVMEMADTPEVTLELARKLHERFPTVSMVLVARTVEPSLYRQAMRAGVSDVLPAMADLEEVGEVLDRAVAESGRLQALAEEDAEEPKGTVIATFATKGGTGKSFVATNLATLLAERHPREVVLVDLDLQAGDAALMLQLLPERGLGEVAEFGPGLDQDALRSCLTPTRDNLYVLAAPAHPIHAEEVTPEVVVRVLDLLREMFRFVVIDGPPFFTDQLLAALDDIDILAVVSSLDVPSIKNLRMSMETLAELGVPRERLRLILNRADSKVGLTVREVEKSLGTTIDLQMPSSREVPFAVNQGQAIVSFRPKSPVSRSLRDGLPLFDASADGRRTRTLPSLRRGGGRSDDR
jgi:pilus assembly protein CpaE